MTFEKRIADIAKNTLGLELSSEGCKKFATALCKEIRRKRPRNRMIQPQDDELNAMKKAGYNLALLQYNKAIGLKEE